AAGKLSWSALTPPEFGELDRLKVAQLSSVGSCTQYEKEFLRKDGTRVPALIGGTLLEGSQEQGLAFVLDLTERRQAETERAARKSAEAANAAKSTFLSSMSHELRSPLNTLLGFARLMERQSALPDQTRQDLAIILRSGEHLRALINQVLELAKIDAGHVLLEVSDFNLHAMLDELEDMFAFKAEMRGMSLQVEFSGAPHFVRGDSLKLRQVLINLLDNAFKFTERGEVALRVHPQPEEGRLGFAVVDTGIGIAAAEIDQLGTAFVRAGAAQREGSGLGLAISGNFVRLMGGALRIASQSGHGTSASFSLALPAVSAAAAPEPLARRVAALAPDQPRYRILVVDDRDEARQLLMRLLTPLGFEVREACDGQQAVALWRAWPAQLIWMDMRMPVMDGRAATRLIKASPGGSATVIIALTASSFEEERADILAAGCDDFLRKPFHETDLFALMQKHLGVQFIYREEGGAGAAVAPLPDAAALAAVPAAQRQRLQQALVALDTTGVAAAIAGLGDRALAHALTTLANEFQYTQILRLLQGANQKELP
ncbi:MAG: ATP-binding protein, partial [Massilia sp.]